MGVVLMAKGVEHLMEQTMAEVVDAWSGAGPLEEAALKLQPNHHITPPLGPDHWRERGGLVKHVLKRKRGGGGQRKRGR